MMLLWDENNKFAVDHLGEMVLSEKPELSFEFKRLRFSDNVEMWCDGDDDQRRALTLDEVEEIKDLITNLRAVTPQKVYGVDSEHKFLGLVDANDSRISVVAGYRPGNDDENWRYVNDEWIYHYYVNDEGYLAPSGHLVEFYPPFGSNSRWDFDKQVWVKGTDMPTAIKEGHKEVLAWLMEKASDLTGVTSSQDLANVVIEAMKPSINKDQHENVKLIVSSVFDEIDNYCETPDDIRIAIGNLRHSVL